MASGYKHFSHTHNLVVHEMPEGVEVSCSGCNSSATKTVYVCWQCNFYLHEQCFHATRSRKHPSHPLHPLNLVPYPTYPSNSFYCNSCKIIGTGFSYTCSDCNFDLHVQCAYSISSATNFHQPHNVTHPNQEIFPQHLHNPNSSVSIPIPTFIPTPIIAHAQYPTNSIPTQTLAIPTPIPVHAQYPVQVQYPTTITQDSYTTQHVSPFSVPVGAQNQTHSAQNAYESQSFTNIPTSVQNSSSVPQNTANFAPTNAPNSQPSQYTQSSQNRTKNQGIKHFSHPHGLVLVNLKHGKKQIACSGCQEILIGKGYACVEENCRFQLDEACFNIQKEIQHKSHPAHPLFLLTTSPYNNEIGTCTCNACFRDGSGFTYHCSICQYDLHVK